MSTTVAPARPAGAWARDLANRYDILAEHYEACGQPLGASLNRAEAAKYHQIAADTDAAFPGGVPAVLEV